MVTGMRGCHIYNLVCMCALLECFNKTSLYIVYIRTYVYNTLQIFQQLILDLYQKFVSHLSILHGMYPIA